MAEKQDVVQQSTGPPNEPYVQTISHQALGVPCGMKVVGEQVQQTSCEKKLQGRYPGFLCPQNYLSYDLYNVESDVKPQINK